MGTIGDKLDLNFVTNWSKEEVLEFLKNWNSKGIVLINPKDKSIDPVKAVEMDGDWFVIPNDLYSKWLEIIDKLSDDDSEDFTEFESIFSEYRTGGDLNNIQLYIKNE